MHPNPAFRGQAPDHNLAFARARGFGMLALSAPEGAPLLAHVPFVISEAGDHLDLHLVRSNPMVRAARSAVPARLAVSGPDGYVSPDWYGMADQVPTWNYVAVHITGRLEPRAAEALPELLDHLSAHFEDHLQPKPPWHRDKMEPAAFQRMLRMIVPFRLQIEEVQGTWKLGQNKPQAARHGAAAQMAAYGVGQETRELAALMRSPIAEPETE